MSKKVDLETLRKQKFIRTCHDEDCPRCGFPETIIVRNAKTFKPIWIECSVRTTEGCPWQKVILTKVLKQFQKKY